MYLPEKDWEVHISVCSLSAEAWGRATVSLCGPTKSGFFVYYRLVSLVHASPIWLSHLGVWGTHLSDEVLEVARCWVQIICSSERSRGVVSSLPIIIMVSGVGFIMRVYLRLSHPFWCKYFLICPKCFSASFWISSRRFFSCIGIDLVCLWVEVSFGGSYVTILDWNSSLDELLARFTKGKSFFLVKFTKNLKRN